MSPMCLVPSSSMARWRTGVGVLARSSQGAIAKHIAPPLEADCERRFTLRDCVLITFA